MIFGGLIAAAVLILGYMSLRTKVEAHRQARSLEKNRVARLTARWEAARATEKRIFDKWTQYELHFDLLLSYPAMTDVSVPQTAKFHESQRVVNRVRLDTFNVPDEPALEKYESAVTAYEHAFLVAEKHAKAVKWNLVPEDDRRILTDMQNVLKVAADGATPEPYRRTLYGRLMKLAGQVSTITFPRPAMDQIERNASESITAR